MRNAQALQRAVGSQERRGTIGAEALFPEGLDTAAAMVALRRLHFYRDLLSLGFEATVWPDRASRTLRAERRALGIDLPELDLVALWATRCGGGRVSIPFIEYLLARSRETAARFLAVDEDRAIACLIGRLDAVIAGIDADAPPSRAGMATKEVKPPDLPRLGEVFILETEAVALCGQGGLVDRLLQVCEERLLATSALS
jgi:hypothetical protein